MSELKARQYYDELIEAGQASEFTKLTSTGINTNYKNIFAFAEDYHEARIQANESNTSEKEAFNIGCVSKTFCKECDTEVKIQRGNYLTCNCGLCKISNKCEHKHIEGSDGCFECVDCGAKDY